MSKNITGTEPVLDGGMSCRLYPQFLNDLKCKAMAEEQLAFWRSVSHTAKNRK